MTSAIIGNGVTTIGESAFRSCNALTSLIISDNVTSIGNSAFCYCETLTSISIGNNIASIGKNAFYGCNAITSVNVKSISSWCNIQYYNFSSNPLQCGAKLYLNGKEINEVIIPEDVIEIKKYAFYGCENITILTIPDNVTSIGNYAFYGCSALTSASIGNNVTSIGEYTFENCYSLSSLIIGKGVTSIYGTFLEHEGNLKECYCFATTPPQILGQYIHTPKAATLYVPKRCGASYNNSQNWSIIFDNIIEMD